MQWRKKTKNKNKQTNKQTNKDNDLHRNLNILQQESHRGRRFVNQR